MRRSFLWKWNAVRQNFPFSMFFRTICLLDKEILMITNVTMTPIMIARAIE